MPIETSNNKKIIKATGWSLATQIIAKIIPPLTSMILARIFAPEVFGIIATITIVTSFAEIFNESGVQKYLIKKDYSDEEELKRDSDVCFWTNIGISLLLWGLVAVFCTPLCDLLRNPGLEIALIVSCSQLPLSAFSTIHIALLQRNYKFKKPFFVQFICSVINLLISLILALAGCGFWSIIIGNISGYFLRAILLSVKSEWRPRFYYSFRRLKAILSFSAWILLEAMAVWATSWFDSLIIGQRLSDHELGVYKNSQSVVNGLLSVPQNSITSVSLVTLSKNASNQASFSKAFLVFQKAMAFALLPIGVGVFLYRDLAVKIVFGSGWEGAELVIGFWSLASVLRILFVSINTPAFVAKGKTKIPLLLQLIDLVILIPSCLLFINYGFEAFVVARSIVRIDIILPSLLFLRFCCGIKLLDVFKNIAKPVLCTSLMAGLALLLQLVSKAIWWEIISIVICAAVYSLAVFVFGKKDIQLVMKSIKNDREPESCNEVGK